MYQIKNQNFRAMLAGSAAVVALSSSAAFAQQVAPENSETVVVSSTRITTAGFNAPTPTTVVGADYIEKVAKDNVFYAITQLPSMMGSTGQEVGVNGTSGGTNGLASFNMFGLGTIRTLTLLDSQRFMPANVTGVPDISEFPQLLIQRVDVVTGGASASWGSDAIGGVVNFVTDKKFEGFKANFSSGVSTYGDNAMGTAQMAFGRSFAGGRGHFEIAAEFSHQDGVGFGTNLGCCSNSLPGGRSWFTEPTILQYSSPASTPAGQPQYFVAALGQQNQLGRYGLINSGPLSGTAFGTNGTPYQFNYGVGPNGAQGVPIKDSTVGVNSKGVNSAAGVTGCVQSFCIGGETDAMEGSGVTLATPLTRGDVYTRLSYDIAPDTNIWLTFNWAEVGSENVPNPDAWLSSLPGFTPPASAPNGLATPPAGYNNVGAVVGGTAVNVYQLQQLPGIQCGTGPTAAQLLANPNILGGPNAFLPASINAACQTAGVTSFGFGSDYVGLGPQLVYTFRDNRRLAAGGDGAFGLFGTDWTWSTYLTHGENDTHIKVRQITLKPYLYAAIDSIAAPANDPLGAVAGTIVCRNLVARQEGCVPFNPFGNIVPTQAQTNWLYGGSKWGPGPDQYSHQMQDAASFSINGTPIEDWAGKISIATGIEYRQEAYDVHGDGAGNGTIAGAGGAAGSPCVDPLLNCFSGTNWYAGSFHNAKGNYNVKEAFLEVGVPLLDSTDWGKADLDVAGRAARYSTSGDAMTWKVGLTWDTPIDGVRLRTLQSRDVRAPNLSELFAAPTTANGTINDPWLNPPNGQQIQVINGTYGNPLLKPEKSINTQLGVVFQPSWLPGFSASVDYYRIAIKGQISTVPVQTSVNNCFQGLDTFCSAIVVNGVQATSPALPASSPNWSQVQTTFINIASTVTDGFNYEASYQFDLQNWDIPGSFTLRTLATNVSKFIANPGLLNTLILESAGANDGNTPHWKVFGVQTYETDQFSFTLSENFISDGRHNLAWLQCTPGSCPVPIDSNHPTVNDNHVPAIVYFNVGGSYNLDEHWKMYFQIDNLLNKNAPPYYANSQNPTDDGVNPFLYDTIGRMFHFGVRVQN
ncbi:MAG TPA: TonB-dependent receptor [Rhizomicrobium sp.]|nr:TonB-dependent receptor [Rhizomicrobium sp.]